MHIGWVDLAQFLIFPVAYIYSPKTQSLYGRLGDRDDLAFFHRLRCDSVSVR
jgi:hypothetical protein